MPLRCRWARQRLQEQAGHEEQLAGAAAADPSSCGSKPGSPPAAPADLSSKLDDASNGCADEPLPIAEPPGGPSPKASVCHRPAAAARHAGHAVPAWVPPLVAANARERSDFASVGTAAGVGIAFWAPVAGMVYAVEEGSTWFTTGMLWKVGAALLSWCSMRMNGMDGVHGMQPRHSRAALLYGNRLPLRPTIPPCLLHACCRPVWQQLCLWVCCRSCLRRHRTAPPCGAPRSPPPWCFPSKPTKAPGACTGERMDHGYLGSVACTLLIAVQHHRSTYNGKLAGIVSSKRAPWNVNTLVMHCPPSLQVVHLGGALLLPAGRAGRPAGRAVVLDDMQAACLPRPTHPRLPPRAARAGGCFCDRPDRHGERCAAVLCSACKHSHACPGIDAGMRVLCTGTAALLLRKGHAGLAYPGLSISPSSFTGCPPAARPALPGVAGYLIRLALVVQVCACVLLWTQRFSCMLTRRPAQRAFLTQLAVPRPPQSQMWCQEGQYAEWGQLFGMPIDVAGEPGCCHVAGWGKRSITDRLLRNINVKRK